MRGFVTEPATISRTSGWRRCSPEMPRGQLARYHRSARVSSEITHRRFATGISEKYGHVKAPLETEGSKANKRASAGAVRE
jgi:hypothetical protein